eukprot:g18826.t1
MPSMKRPAGTELETTPVKKAKSVGVSWTKGPLPLDAKLKRTEVTSNASYMDKRSDSLLQCGSAVQRAPESLTLQFKNASGEKVAYKKSDLRYDLQAKRLELVPMKVSCSLVKVKHTSAAASLASGVPLHNGVLMPVVGFGTYKLSKSEVIKPLVNALKMGYRLIDTAQVYENEQGVGEAIRQSGVAREDVFIETKVWRSSHGYERTIKACKQSLRKLGVNYLEPRTRMKNRQTGETRRRLFSDLYVIHWPGPKTGWPLKRGQVCPPDWTPAMRDKGTWRAMEELYEQGLVKAIGAEDFFAFPPVQQAAKAHKATGAQVLLKWAMQKGCLWAEVNGRMMENANVFGFKLSSSEMKALDGLHTGTRYAWKGVDPDTVQ